MCPWLLSPGLSKMARRRFRGVSRRNKDQIWSVSLFNDAVVGPGVTSNVASLVAKTDWEASSVSAQRATLLRIRGWFSMRQETTVGVGSSGAVYYYISLVDEDATVALGDNPNTYADEDILWTGGAFLPSLGDASARSYIKDWILDVKSMRKMRTGQVVDMAVTNTTANNIRLSGLIRSLVRMGGS